MRKNISTNWLNIEKKKYSITHTIAQENEKCI